MSQHEDSQMLVTVMGEGHQGKVSLAVQVQEHLLVLSVHAHLVQGLSHQVTPDHLFLRGLKIQVLEEAFIHLAADHLHPLVHEAPQDVILGGDIPLQEEDVNPAHCLVLQEDLHPPQGLHLKHQIFFLPSFPVHLQALQIPN